MCLYFFEVNASILAMTLLKSFAHEENITEASYSIVFYFSDFFSKNRYILIA